MNPPLIRRCLALATLGAAALALSACGGASGGDTAVAAEPLARASAPGETATANADAETDAPAPGDVLAADAGAATQEPR